MPEAIPELEGLTPEDDFFARVALHNKLVTREQVAVCAQLIAKVVKEGGVHHSLASVLIHRGYITPQHAAAVQKAVKQYAASEAKAAKAAERKALAEPEKPSAPEAAAALLGTGSFRKRAKAGESQVIVPVKAAAADKRMYVNVETRRNAATLVVDCTALYGEDAPSFEAACHHLLESEQPSLSIDMTRVKRVPSLLFGELTKASNAAQAAGCTLTVILNKETGRVARMILGDLVKVQVR